MREDDGECAAETATGIGIFKFHNFRSVYRNKQFFERRRRVRSLAVARIVYRDFRAEFPVDFFDVQNVYKIVAEFPDASGEGVDFVPASACRKPRNAISTSGKAARRTSARTITANRFLKRRRW